MRIQREEFEQRIDRIRVEMAKRRIDALAVYGDEYRKENLRYVSNFWPIFERGMCFIGRYGSPILAGAPEGERYAREQSVWSDVRNVKDFACVSVPEEIDYPLAVFSSFAEIVDEVLGSGRTIGLVGTFDVPAVIRERLTASRKDLQIVPADELIQKMRVIKSPAEISCLREAGRIACAGYSKLLETAVPGNTELFAAGSAEGAARREGAEAITFHVFGSGPRTNTIIGRPTSRIIKDGDMIMSALAVQYEGYTATVEYPFVAGTASAEQREMLDVLFEAANVQLGYLKGGTRAAGMVEAVRQVFKRHGYERYDVYPPMHGIGLAEAESPYPDASSAYDLLANMCVNSDISLFGHPCGSNRIEEGFVITESGPESLTPLIRQLCANHSKK